MILGEKRPIRAQAGQERALVKFAWKRIDLNDGRRVWLERYVEIQRVVPSTSLFGSLFLSFVSPEEGGAAPPEWKPDPQELANWQTVRLVPFNEFLP